MSESLPPPPYPAETLARGWRFEIDMEAFKRSDTWKVARTPMMRAHLLLLWGEAWQEKPCGTLPDDDALIALLVGMSDAIYAKHRAVLRRGWSKASDGRLYHDTITIRVLAMLEKRAKDAGRAAKRRAGAADSKGSPPEVPGESRVTTPVVQGEFDTKHQAPSTLLSDPDGSGGKPPSPTAARPRAPAPKPPVDDADALLWRETKALLVVQQTVPTAKDAGVLLGALAAKYGKDVFREAASATLEAKPVNAHTFLVGLCETAAGKRQPLNRQEAQEQRNRSVADEWAAEQGANA